MKDIKIINNIEPNDLFLMRRSVKWKELSIKQIEIALKNTMCIVSINVLHVIE